MATPMRHAVLPVGRCTLSCPQASQHGRARAGRTTAKWQPPNPDRKGMAGASARHVAGAMPRGLPSTRSGLRRTIAGPECAKLPTRGGNIDNTRWWKLARSSSSSSHVCSTRGSSVLTRRRRPGPCAACDTWKRYGNVRQEDKVGCAGGWRWQIARSAAAAGATAARPTAMASGRRSNFLDGGGVGRPSENAALLLLLPLPLTEFADWETAEVILDGKGRAGRRRGGGRGGGGGGGGGGRGALGLSMSIFDRMARVIRSYTNALLSDMEDPEKMIDQTVSEMEEDLSRLKKATAKVMAALKRLEDLQKASESTSAQWYRRAKLAMSNGDESLAMAALVKKQEQEEAASLRRSEIEHQREAIKKLREATVTLERRIGEAKSKKEPLKARAKSAKLGRQVVAALGGIDTGSALGTFEEMEKKVMAMEAEAEALAELTAGAEDELASKFLLTEANVTVDEEFEALKREMKGTAPTIKGHLPPGRTDGGGAATSSSKPMGGDKKQ